ncbi:hypothetical protein Tsubulata_017093 [Turnera subulata]|uniref:Glycosyltransferase N-terminal domain-containing protein n=1 Tax=Turnera subulata TaxID=218843 RepID=A0A9Q0G443_9ROSI|nr:hypothetical protein Tsubulata_017093 [Turnera subulata]
MERDKRAAVKGRHVLVFPLPAQGHINPMLQFSKRLAAKGIKVTLITTSSYLMAMQEEQALPTSINLEPIFDGFREGERAASVDDYLECFTTTAPGSLAEVIKKHSSTENPPRCLIYDTLLPWALDVAQDSGIYNAATFSLNPVQLVLYITMSFKGSYPGAYDLVFSRFSNIEKATWVLWNVFDDLEDEVGSLVIDRL